MFFVKIFYMKQCYINELYFNKFKLAPSHCVNRQHEVILQACVYKNQCGWHLIFMIFAVHETYRETGRERERNCQFYGHWVKQSSKDHSELRPWALTHLHQQLPSICHGVNALPAVFNHSDREERKQRQNPSASALAVAASGCSSLSLTSTLDTHRYDSAIMAVD